MKKTIITMGLMLWAFAAAGQPDDHEGHDHDDQGHNEGIELEISPDLATKIGLELGLAGAGTISTSVVFPAEIKLNRDQAAAISPRYSSIVKKVFFEIGDQVNKGDVLVSLENHATLAVYTIKAPLAGIVISKATSVGEAAAENKVLFEIADLSTVWADISIFPRFQDTIRKNTPVEFIAHDGQTTEGKVKYLSPLLSRETRTFTARCVLQDHPGVFTPGVFVRARINTHSTEVPVRIEREAVQLVDGEHLVFVPGTHGFEGRIVQIGLGEEHFIEITDGLEPGEEYVARGAFSLKAEMITSGMDSHAGHGH